MYNVDVDSVLIEVDGEKLILRPETDAPLQHMNKDFQREILSDMLRTLKINVIGDGIEMKVEEYMDEEGDVWMELHIMRTECLQGVQEWIESRLGLRTKVIYLNASFMSA